MSTTTRFAQRRSRLMIGLTGLTVAPLILTACGTGVSAEDDTETVSGKAVTIENCGRQLSFTATPKSIVSLMPNQTELLLRLGVRDSVVGHAQTELSPLSEELQSEAESIPVLSTDAPPPREDLLATGADLVVSPTSYEFTAEQGFASLDQLEESGAQAYIATAGCEDRRTTAEVGDVLTDVENLGRIVDAPAAAEAITSAAEKRLTAVGDAIDGKSQPTVAQLFVEGTTLSAVGAGLEADIIKTAGGDNVFDPKAEEFSQFGAAQVNAEEIISRNPDVIVFGVTGADHEKETREYLTRTFPDVAAVKSNRLVPVAATDLQPGSLGTIRAVETVAKGLHPEAF